MTNNSEKQPFLQTELIWNDICPVLTVFSSLFPCQMNMLPLLVFSFSSLAQEYEAHVITLCKIGCTSMVAFPSQQKL